ncbi:Golgi membrane protein 1 isoform X2 [Thalassophryne amazonica]|uniref:Golgi membrane protein 1 isoform X2 n=1 Tax=Thalassophryne amazonica TaxID=390379 RepID=UPI00147191D6|nr:Golgi membrane protein 1 isoform X2 [Thalassophryne amazonica]
MGALGNGRRGGRAPPLLIGALIACILVLGFNYWVSSSRNLELQTKLYELEGHVRRGAADRGVAEKTIQRQKEQISRIENLYKEQLDGAQITCSQEKDTLRQNISTSTKTIQELKGQVNQLSNDLGKLQNELQNCQKDLNTLNKKVTYDMTQCNTQILSQKELCDEKVAAIKLEFEKNWEKLVPPHGVSNEKVVDETVKKEPGNVLDITNAEVALNQNSSTTDSKANVPSELLTNDITVDKAVDNPVAPPSGKDLPKLKSVPAASLVQQENLEPPKKHAVMNKEEGETVTSKLLTNNLTENKEREVMQIHTKKGPQLDEEEDPGMEDIHIDQEKENEKLVGHTVNKPEHDGAEEQAALGLEWDKLQQNKQSDNIDTEMEEELADYNGDDENEGEFEADKQAALSQI